MDLSWSIPDEIRDYLRFQALRNPRCEWAEKLCIKYHALAVVRYVLVADTRSDRDLWLELKAYAPVTPKSVAQWCRMHGHRSEIHLRELGL